MEAKGVGTDRDEEEEGKGATRKCRLYHFRHFRGVFFLRRTFGHGRVRAPETERVPDQRDDGGTWSENEGEGDSGRESEGGRER